MAGNTVSRPKSKIIFPFDGGDNIEITQGNISAKLKGVKMFKLISIQATSETPGEAVEIEFSNNKIVAQRNVDFPMTARPDRFSQEGQ